MDFDRVRQQYDLHTVVARYCPDLQLKGAQYWAICPFHDDSRPTNFNVYRAKDGTERFRCFVCDAHGDVIDFVSMIERCSKPEAVEKITGEALPAIGDFTPKKMPPNQTAAWVPIIPVPDDAPGYKPEITFNPTRDKLVNYKDLMTRLDPYHDAEGRLMFWVIRLRFDDGRKACPQITYCAGPGGERKWCARRMEPPFPMMGLDDLALHKGRQVLIVSGEKNKAEAQVEAPLFVVVTWLGGDSCVDKTDWSPLVGRRRNYHPDDDDSGRRAMKYIQDKLAEIEKSGTGISG